MSHFTKVSTKINDLEALRAAVARMGFQIIENAECRYYQGVQEKDLVIKLPGKYDVGLVKSADGYEIEADFYGGYVASYVGAGAGKLLQMYAVEKAKKEARLRGYSVTERQDGEDIIVSVRAGDGGILNIICKPDGTTICVPSNAPGKNCMKFKDLEAVLGKIDEFKYTAEFFADDPEQVQLRGQTLCG